MKIFVISLIDSTERRDSICKQFVDKGAEFTFFDAVDGRADSHHPLFDKYNYLKRLWFTSGKMPSKGEVGCYASHYLLWKKCIELNEPIIILEDDISLCQSFSTSIDKVEKFTSKYGFLRLEAEAMPKRGESHIVESGLDYDIRFISDNTRGAIAYSISPIAARKLVQKSQSWSVPVDTYMGAYYKHGVPSYLLSPSLAYHPGSFSTIVQAGPEIKTPLYRKPTREIYTIYKRLVHRVATKRYIKENIV
ncbi:glycosyltransferase family 25 protein [Vibrio sp. S4M6]|uniref:glycosyltransferase family 25 protein n=1 Tax=Vibrio sinus TaxID=2946865 RepID=UPI00202A11C1|nr:glycosyltransferase family 25 protein [Vibrio sinus]MCL9780338.1 glycosyltransferase family 25 protein [Vibrio sinus]